MADPRTEPRIQAELRNNNNTTSPTANQTDLTYVPVKLKPAPDAPAKGGDLAPKTADWSPFNRKPGDKTGLIN
jgi:hypothetical protein